MSQLTFTMTNTGLYLTIAFIIFGLWDAYLVWVKGVGSSVSCAMVNLVCKSPVVVFLLGWLMCHFLGGQMFLTPALQSCMQTCSVQQTK